MSGGLTLIKNLWAALGWAETGWPVFPLVDDGYLPRIQSPHDPGSQRCRGECGKYGHGVHDATTDPITIGVWWRLWPSAGIGGGLAGRLVVDLDPRNGSDATWEQAIRDGREWPATREHHTKRGGRHLVFECDPERATALNQRPVLGRGIDVKAGPNAYVVLPPTRGYKVFTDIDPAPLPAELVGIADNLTPKLETAGETKPPRYASGQDGTAYGIKGLNKELEKLTKAWEMDPSADTFNNQLNKCAFAVGQLVAGGELDDTYGRGQLESFARDMGAPPDQFKTIDSGYSSGLGSPRSAPTKKGKPLACTDVGNMERFVRDHHDAVKYAEGLGWLWWDGTKWKRNSNSMVRMLAVETAKGIYREAADTNDRDREKQLAQWAHASQFSARIAAMVGLAQHHPQIRVEADELDADPFLLTVANGTVNLKTGELLEFDQAHLITRSSPIEYDRSDPSPQFDSFMAWFCQGDVETIEYLQLLVGQTLIGSNAAQVFIFLYGPGGNGKSQFVEIVQGLMGEWTEVADARLFLSKPLSNSGHNADLAKLAGARYVPVSETQQGRQWDEAFIKQVSGGDRMTASFKGLQPFDFTPQFTVWVYGNHEPVIKGDDDGIWRRVRKINTYAKVEEGQRRENYGQHLLDTEGPGIMAWAVRGAIRAAMTPGGASGFPIPHAVRTATNEYRISQDELGIFVDTYLEVGTAARIGNNELWEVYQQWITGGGSPFAKNISDLGRQLVYWGGRHSASVSRASWAQKSIRGLRGIGPKGSVGRIAAGSGFVPPRNGQTRRVIPFVPRE